LPDNWHQSEAEWEAINLGMCKRCFGIYSPGTPMAHPPSYWWSKWRSRTTRQTVNLHVQWVVVLFSPCPLGATRNNWIPQMPKWNFNLRSTLPSWPRALKKVRRIVATDCWSVCKMCACQKSAQKTLRGWVAQKGGSALSHVLSSLSSNWCLRKLANAFPPVTWHPQHLFFHFSILFFYNHSFFEAVSPRPDWMQCIFYYQSCMNGLVYWFLLI